MTLAVLLCATSVTPALASDEAEVRSAAQCASGYGCVWTLTNYGGGFFQTTSGLPVSTGMTIAKSAGNRSTYALRIYSGTGGTGTSVCLTPGQMIAAGAIPARSMRVLATIVC